jgi:hypothetical protein
MLARVLQPAMRPSIATKCSVALLRVCVQRCTLCTDATQTMSIKELQQLLNERGVSHDDCFDKQDLIARASSMQAAHSATQPDDTPRTSREQRQQLIDDGCVMAEGGDLEPALVNFRQALQLDIEDHGVDSVEAADTHFNIATASSLLWTLVPPSLLKPEVALVELSEAMHHIKECIRIRPVEHQSTAEAHLQAFDIWYAAAKLREAQLKKAVQQSMSGTTDDLVELIKEDAEQCLKHAQKGVLIHLKRFGEKHDLLVDARVKAALAHSLRWEITGVSDSKDAAIGQLEKALATAVELHGKANDDVQQIEALLLSLQMGASGTE